MPRSYIREFSQYNPAYINAEVAFYTVEDGERTETLATLYAASTGSTQAENPQRLGSRGMLLNPVYHEDPIIAVVVSEGQPSHSTGIIKNIEAAADRAEEAAENIETAYASFAAIETARDEAQTAAATAQAAAAGIKWKNSVKAATTSDITLSGEQTIDGIALVAGDRCLVKNQATASENGIYQVSASAWARSFDLDAWSEIPSATVSVEEGSTQADTSWTCTSDEGGTLETTDISWALLNITNTYNKTEIDAKDATKLSLSGGTLTGDIELAGDATEDLHPATKRQLDALRNYAFSENNTTAVTSSLIAPDDTIPQITEGAEFASLSFTPSRVGAVLEVSVIAHIGGSSVSWVTAAVFQDGEADAILSARNYLSTAQAISALTNRTLVVAADTGTINFTARFAASAGSARLNGGSSRVDGGALKSSLMVREIA
ncbi:MAG: hypothetical protein CL843_19860 [Crocinitomicaceae bacterium]|nr:hypothetical protein [Crocinitomicaceae bacterium]